MPFHTHGAGQLVVPFVYESVIIITRVVLSLTLSMATVFAEVLHGLKRWFVTAPDTKPDFDPNETSFVWVHKHYNATRSKLGDRLYECTLRPGEVGHVYCMMYLSISSGHTSGDAGAVHWPLVVARDAQYRRIRVHINVFVVAIVLILADVHCIMIHVIHTAYEDITSAIGNLSNPHPLLEHRNALLP